METGQFKMTGLIFILIFTLPACLLTTVVAVILTPFEKPKQWKLKLLVSLIGALLGLVVFFPIFKIFTSFVGSVISLAILWLVQRFKKEG